MGYKKIGLGGGCHWCTEAVFASLIGVHQVEQGWIAAHPPNDAFSEAVIVTYNPEMITLKDLLHIHLLTHSSTANHAMRHKYRSAIYWFNQNDEKAAAQIINELQVEFEEPLVTTILPFAAFKLSEPVHLNYYYADPEKPFCQLYIHPKLEILRKRFSKFAK